MTLGEYLTNPYGTGVGVAPTSLIKDTVTSDLNKYYPHIPFTLYKTRDKHLIFHCKLPSRTKEAISYDVVIELDASNEEMAHKGIAKLPMRVFSNSPSFYYTYAKVFDEKELLCPWLKKKYERQITRKEPKQRNPSRIVGYERTVYTCIFYIHQKMQGRSNLFIMQKASTIGYKELANQVRTQDEMEALYEKAPYTKAIREQKEKAAKEKAEKELLKKRAEKPKSSNVVAKTATTGKTSKTGKTKKTGFISKIKKIGRK
jgi:hypothetical protein